ncbi:MAG: hypothetical protein GXX80_12180 [Thermotogaceae bacterium]|nr:hypothetical protein [Thermotogaceae bacterium]
MELEKSTFNQLLKYLKSHGYPEESFSIEHSVGNGLRVDLAIIDPLTKEVLSIFEIKNKRKPSTESFGRNQIEAYRETLDKGIPCYLVFPPIPGTNTPEIVRVTFDDENLNSVSESPQEVLEYYSMRKARTNSIIVDKKAASKKVVDGFVITARLIAAAFAVFSVLNILKIASFDAGSITLMLTASGFLIAPYVSKMTIGILGLERLQKQSESIKK